MLTKNNTVQIKGTAVLCMIFLHLFANPHRIPIESKLDWMGVSITHAFQICVPIYLFMAGYGLQCVAVKGRVTWQSIGKRLQKLYVSFWWVAVPFIIIGCIVGYYTLDVKSIFYNLSGLTASYNGEWWFFSLYVEQLILFYFISKITLGWKGYLLLMVGLLVLTRVQNNVLHLDDSVIVERHLKMVLIDLNIFMLGCFFAKFDIFRWLYGKCTWLFDNYALAPLLLIIPILVRAYLPVIGVTELFTIPIFIIGVVNICNFVYGGKILFFFGKHSMNLWLIHSFFIFYYLRNITFLTSNPFIMFFTVIGCSLGCSMVIEFLKTKFHL